VKAVEIYKKITKEHEEAIDKILGNMPDFGWDFRDQKPLPNRRRRFD